MIFVLRLDTLAKLESLTALSPFVTFTKCPLEPEVSPELNNFRLEFDRVSSSQSKKSFMAPSVKEMALVLWIGKCFGELFEVNTVLIKFSSFSKGSDRFIEHFHLRYRAPRL